MATYTPIYLDYDLIELILKSDAIKVSLTEDQSGAISKELVLYYMCQAESYVYNTMFSNYVDSPLQTRDGLPFNTLELDQRTLPTYQGIINVMTNYAILTILNKVFTGGGNGNGEKQIKFITIAFNESARPYKNKLDNTLSPELKNVMRYLKPCDNASNRVPLPAGVPDIPSGLSEGLLALTNIPFYG